MGKTGKHVHVVGTGTIGEPLLGLLCTFRKELGIDTSVSTRSRHSRTTARRSTRSSGAAPCWWRIAR